MTKTQPQQKPTAADHTYRIEVPNLIDEMRLSPFEMALYVHIKRRAGDKGVCKESCRELAEATRMSGGQVSKAKNSLKQLGLIEVQTVKGRDLMTISDIWEKNLKHFAPHLVERSPSEQSDHGVNKVITVRSNCSPSEQSDHSMITPTPPIRIQEPLQEPSERTIQELSLSLRASHAPVASGDEPEREREVEPRWKTKYTLEQVQACARAKGLGDGWISEALLKGMHDWQVEQHLNPPLPLPPVAAVLLDPKQCDDCHGTNFYEPGGRGNGVAKCRHDGLLVKLKARAETEADVETDEARGSPPAAVG